MNTRGLLHVTLSGLLLASAGTLSAQQVNATQAAFAPSSSNLDDYIGQYRVTTEPDVINAIYREGDKLYIESERSPRAELQSESPDHFLASGSGLRLAFTRDAAGKVTGLKANYGAGTRGAAGERTFDRFSDTPAHLNHFRAYERSEAMVPARDGAKLHVVILRPVGSDKNGEPLPKIGRASCRERV